MDTDTRAVLQMLRDFMYLFLESGAIQDGAFLSDASEIISQADALLAQ